MNRRVTVALGTAGALVAGSAVYVLAMDSPAESSPEPRPGRVHTMALRPVSGQGGMGLPARKTEPFSLLGVSWDDVKARVDGPVRVRTRSAVTGRWSPWRLIETGEADAPDAGAPNERPSRGATEPLWVGPSNGVEVTVNGKGGPLPKGLRVDLVDPGDGRARKPRQTPRAAGPAPGDMVLAAATGTPDPTTSPSEGTTAPVEPTPTTTAPAEPASPTPTTSPSGEPSASPTTPPAAPTTSTAPRPAIVARAGWGADEGLVRNPPSYAPQLKLLFTHHTAGTNDYTCAESPAIIRSIMLYHVQTNGWDDIGYNFLVDKCGTIYEGRGGGVDRPVIGAHTYGFNTGSTGVAVLGDHTTTAPANAAVGAIAKVAAWKLGLHGIDPTGTAQMTTTINNGKFPAGVTVTFNTIAAHRDGYQTECPGDQLYGRLGTIRTQAKAWSTPATSVTLTSVGGATKVGTTYYTKGTVTLGWPSAAVSRYEILVDDKVVATAAGSATSARVTLAAGTRRVQVRAVNINGTTATSPVHTMVSDATAPVFGTAPALTVRSGASVGTNSTIPVRLGWKVTDNTLLHSLKATSPTAYTFATNASAWWSTAKNNTAQAWTLAAADAAGNTRTASITRTAALVHDTSASRSGTWQTWSGTSNLGGKAYASKTKGASASYTFTGRSVGLIFQRRTTTGAAHIYVDGVKVATVDTRASSNTYRHVLWTHNWSTSGKHTVKIVVAGTSGRPTVVTDGAAYIK